MALTVELSVIALFNSTTHDSGIPQDRLADIKA
jgi:hypothetical protein